MAVDRYEAVRRALAWPIARRSLAIMLIVASILNVINQGDAILWLGTVSW